MRAIALSLVLLVAVMQPASAGDAENPDISDACGEREPTDANYVFPEADLCGAWFTADVSGGAPVLDITLRTLEPTRDDVREASAAFTIGECRWDVEFLDRIAERRSVPEIERFTYVDLDIRCDPYSRPCYPELPVSPCTAHGHDRTHSFELPLDVVTINGTDLTFRLDMAAIDMTGTTVEDAAVSPGDVLTELVATVATNPSQMFPPYFWAVGYTWSFADIARGDSYTLPVPEDK